MILPYLLTPALLCPPGTLHGPVPTALLSSLIGGIEALPLHRVLGTVSLCLVCLSSVCLEDPWSFEHDQKSHRGLCQSPLDPQQLWSL